MTLIQYPDLFPEKPTNIELRLYEFELPSSCSVAKIAKDAHLYHPETDIWLDLLHVPFILRNGDDGTHYGTLIMDTVIKRYKGKARAICFSFGPRVEVDDDYVRKFYEKHYGFKFVDDIPNHSFGFLELQE